MNSVLFLLIGYISCTLKCEMIVSEGVTNYETLVPPKSIGTLETSGVESINAGEQPEIVKQQILLIKPSDDATDAREQPDNLEQPLVLEATPTDTVATTSPRVLPEIIEQTNATIIGDQPDIMEQPNATIIGDQPDIIEQQNATIIGDQPDIMEQPNATIIGDQSDVIEQPNATIIENQSDIIEQTKVSIISPSLNKTDADDEFPDNMYQPEVGKITSAVHKTGDSGQTTNINQPENIEDTTKQVIQKNDVGPAKIKVDDALKILENSKKKYALESIALIKKLNWLRSEFNITELEIEHKIDPKLFDYLSNNGMSSSNMTRRRELKDDTEFELLKNAIMKEKRNQ